MTSQAERFVPIVEIDLETNAKADRARLVTALSESCGGATQLHFVFDDETGIAKLVGADERRLAQVIDDLRRVHHIDFNTSSPQVAYRETITRRVEVDYVHKKQRGGSGEFARVRLTLEPRPSDVEYALHCQVAETLLPRRYANAVEQGLRQALTAGIVMGLPVIALEAILSDGAYHDVDSSVLAFEIAGRMALREALLKGGPALLEPAMKLEVITPENFVGAVIHDLKARGGKIEHRGGRPAGDETPVRAIVIAANLLGYAEALREITQGRASYTMQFDHYAQIPPPDDPGFRPAVGMRAQMESP